MSNVVKEWYSVEVMAREIDKTVKPIEVDGVVYHGQMARIMGPERVRMSHNKNSVTIGEMYPNLKELLGA